MQVERRKEAWLNRWREGGRVGEIQRWRGREKPVNKDMGGREKGVDKSKFMTGREGEGIGRERRSERGRVG